EIALPGLPRAQSQPAVPAQALGELVGVLVGESEQNVAYDEADQHRLEVVASLLGTAIEVERARAGIDAGGVRPAAIGRPAAPRNAPTLVRFFPVDGSTFVDGDYLIKGVAGRILWTLLHAHDLD